MPSLPYSIEDDFQSGVDPELLGKQISASDVEAVYLHINTEEGECFIFFETQPSSGDEAIVDALVSEHTVVQADKNFLVAEYENPRNALVKETWYSTDNGDGTYSHPVEETVYSYTSKNKVLLSKVVTPLFPDGTPSGDPETWEYTTDSMKKIMKKVSA